MAPERASRRTAPAARWKSLQRVYPIYLALAAHFQLNHAPYASLEEIGRRPAPEAMERIEGWLEEMDERVQVVQLRQFLQSTELTEENFAALVERCLSRPEKTGSDRDKLDFLLAQYVSACAPPGFHDRDPELHDMAAILEPVLGRGVRRFPTSLQRLRDLADAARRCCSLPDLQAQRIFERGRELKLEAGEAYCEPVTLLAFTYLNCLLRRVFNRLVDSELQEIDKALRTLEAAGVSQVDCSALQLSSAEPLANVRQIRENWKDPLISDYRLDRCFEQLPGLRAALEKSVAEQSLPTAFPVAVLDRRLQQVHQELAELRTMMSRLTGALQSAGLLKEAEPPSIELDWSPEAKAEPAPSLPPPAPAKSGPSVTAEVAGEQVVEPSPVALAGEVSACVERVRRLLAPGKRGAASASIAVANTHLLLTAGEVAAFLSREDEIGEAVQRCVAVRVLLIEALQQPPQPGRKARLAALAAAARFDWAQVEFLRSAPVPKQPGDAELIAGVGRQLQAMLWKVKKSD
jgi:hypothetical protein